MAATKYQVLYRYINEATNTPITNNMESKYEATCELYADPDHKIFSINKADQDEALAEQQEIISYGNNSENPKNNMLFAYDGTKKIKHKKWIEDSTGYIVRDWKQIKRNLIGNEGDFTKEFTTINASTPEDGGTVICNEAIMKKYFPNELTVATSGSFTGNEMREMLVNATFFSLGTISWEDHMYPSKEGETYGYNGYGPKFIYYTGPILMNGVTLSTFKGYNNFNDKIGYNIIGNRSDENLYSKATIKQTQIKTTVYPGHYEDSNEAPYLIMDTYKRIQLSPWFVNSTYSSLESALTKAKALVEMIGINNVKLIKIVPFDQIVKIK